MITQSLDSPFSLPRPQVNRAEAFLILQTLVVAAAAVAVATWHDIAVAWGAFGVSFLPAVGLLSLGFWMRATRPAMARMADMAIAGAIYIGFSGVIAILIYTRFPIAGPLLDTSLAAFDAHLGYVWSDFVHRLAATPDIGWLLGWVYLSSLPQLALLVVYLALTGRTETLHRALIAGTTSLIVIVAYWWVWPSFGPATLQTIPQEIADAIGLVHAAEEGARMLALAEQGAPLIHPGMIMGTIAFPSYHTVMMLVVLWYAWNTPAFWPAVIVNLGMVPAILGHGGHHLLDVLAAPLPFALAVLLANRLTSRGQSGPRLCAQRALKVYAPR